MRVTAWASLAIGIVGAVLDVSSGYSLAEGDAMSGGNGILLAGCLVAVGALALSAGVASVLPQMQERARYVGLLMEVCGVAMAALSAWAPMMAPLTDFAMLAVGGLMVLSGALMQRKTAMPPRV